jgi:hypothetical protein
MRTTTAAQVESCAGRLLRGSHAAQVYFFALRMLRR